MKKIVILSLIILSVFQVSLTFAESDRFVYINETSKYLIYLDTKTVNYSNNGEFISFWIKYEYTKDGVSSTIKNRTAKHLPVKNFERLSYSLEHYLVSYNRKYSLSAAINFAEDGSTIEINDYSKYEINDWYDIPPGTIIECIHDFVMDWVAGNDGQPLEAVYKGAMVRRMISI